LRNLALTDDLTGLHNRRGLFALAGSNSSSHAATTSARCSFLRTSMA